MSYEMINIYFFDLPEHYKLVFFLFVFFTFGIRVLFYYDYFNITLTTTAPL